MSLEVFESHFTQNIGIATGSGRISTKVAVYHRKWWPYVTGSGRMSSEVVVYHQKWPCVTGSSRVSPEVAVCHRKWPHVTGSGRMSPEVAVCHRKWPYITGSGRMSPELCRSCLSHCEPNVDRACRPKIIQLFVYSSKNSCSIPINTKTMTTICGLIKSFTHKNQ